MDEISEADFHENWGVQVAATGDLLCFDDIQYFPEGKVWTIVASGDDDDGNWYAIPGIHHVNSLGYVTTLRRWHDPMHQAIYYLDDAL